MERIDDGLANGAADLDTAHSFDGLWDRTPEHSAPLACDALIDEAIAEIAVEVADMLDAAIAKRLPWTWEPER